MIALASSIASVLLPGPRPFPLGVAEMAFLAVLALALASFFALMRAALLHSVPSRVLDCARGDERRAALRPVLARAEPLATSATVCWITCQILFVVFVWVLVGEILGGEGLSGSSMGLSLVITVPLLVVAGEFLPAALRGERSDRLLSRVLPAFELVQRPLAALILSLEATRRGLMRLLRIPQPPPSTREIVEGLRAVIEAPERQRELAESEREFIENALGFHGVALGEVMTPRTEIEAVELDEGVQAVVQRIALTGHSRIPVYERTLDRIAGVAHAQEILQALARGELERCELRSLLRPVLFAPETKLASELLDEFRHSGQKIAIVLDEYGGTAGLITLGDLLTELLGAMPAEPGRGESQAIARQPDGCIEVLGTTRVSEVNAELGLALPEEQDYETLAGYVLARLGRLPLHGETFEGDGARFTVLEASDRRVLRIGLRLFQSQTAR